MKGTPECVAALLTALIVAASCATMARAAEVPASVDAARMKGADRDAANWLSYGRTYSEQRFSPLSRITAGNAKQLGAAFKQVLGRDDVTAIRAYLIKRANDDKVAGATK